LLSSIESDRLTSCRFSHDACFGASLEVDFALVDLGSRVFGVNDSCHAHERILVGQVDKARGIDKGLGSQPVNIAILVLKCADVLVEGADLFELTILFDKAIVFRFGVDISLFVHDSVLNDSVDVFGLRVFIGAKRSSEDLTSDDLCKLVLSVSNSILDDSVRRYFPAFREVLLLRLLLCQSSSELSFQINNFNLSLNCSSLLGICFSLNQSSGLN